MSGISACTANPRPGAELPHVAERHCTKNAAGQASPNATLRAAACLGVRSAEPLPGPTLTRAPGRSVAAGAASALPMLALPPGARGCAPLPPSGPPSSLRPSWGWGRAAQECPIVQHVSNPARLCGGLPLQVCCTCPRATQRRRTGRRARGACGTRGARGGAGAAARRRPGAYRACVRALPAPLPRPPRAAAGQRGSVAAASAPASLLGCISAAFRRQAGHGLLPCPEVRKGVGWGRPGHGQGQHRHVVGTRAGASQPGAPRGRAPSRRRARCAPAACAARSCCRTAALSLWRCPGAAGSCPSGACAAAAARERLRRRATRLRRGAAARPPAAARHARRPARVRARALSMCSPAQTACRRVTRRRRAHGGAFAGAGPRAGSVQPATLCPLHAISQTEANSRGRARLAPLEVLGRLQRGQPRGVAGLQRRAALLPLRSLPGRLQALPARRAQHESSVRRGRAACGAVPRTAAGPAARPSAAAARPGRRGAREGARQRPRRRRRSVPRR